MAQKLSMFSRPFGVAFGLMIVLNLALALDGPRLPTTRMWLDVPIPEPWLSVFACILGGALVAPHGAAAVPWARCLIGGIFSGFAVLSFVSVVTFFQEIHEGLFLTDFPVPLSAFIACLLVLEFVRIISWRAAEPVIPPPARFFFSSILVVVAFLLLGLAHVVTFGHADFRRPADAAVVFGAKVYSDGRPSSALIERLETAIDLYEKGYVRRLVMTGAADPNGQSEPDVMRSYALKRGIPEGSIEVDREGYNTRASARGCARLAGDLGLKSLLCVTQYFHCARVKMAFERQGLECYTVPTCSLKKEIPGLSRKLAREGFFLLREAVAFPFYWFYYR